MALVFADRVKETSTSVGTGAFTLNGAVLGYQSFSAIGNGNNTYYAIYEVVSGDWEVGVGTYTASGTSLSRDTILASSNANLIVTFGAGTKEVFVTYPAERSVYRDAANTYTVQQAFNALTTNTAGIGTATITAGTVATTPTSGTDIANKSYVDTIAAAGIHYHEPVFVESPSTVGNLNALYNQPGGPGVGVGATLTNNGTKAALVIDGVLMTTTKRVLIYNQTNAFENGVYTVTTVGTPDPGGTNWVLTRATDADTYSPSNPNSLGQGDAFFVTAGDTGAGEGYVVTTVGVITFGTTAITFSQFSASVAYNAGTGLNLSPATTFNISNTAVTPASYGTASAVGSFTVNAQGQLTFAVDTPILITSSQVSGLAASATTNTTDAANITSGTLPSGRLIGGYTNVTGVGTLTAGTWNATTIGTAYGGTGQTTYTDGQLLIGNTTGNTLTKTTLTAGSGVNITNGSGAITISATGAGTVTSVAQSFTGGLISVSGSPIISSGTLALTVAGTSGGIPYFSSATTWATSAALAANALVIGGGAGVAPSTITTGTGVVTALGVNTGSVGAFVVNGDALGTPSSGVLTNCTFPTLNQNTTGSAATFTSTTQNSQFNSIGVDTAASNTAGEIRATNNVTAFYSSDRNFKENINDVENALQKVCAIGSKTFDWTQNYIESRGGEDGYFVQKSDFGVIAQDVQEVFPQAVRTRTDGTLAVDYEKLATLAFGAIKELVKRIEALEVK